MCPVGSFAAASVRPGRAVCLRTSSLSVSFSSVATLLDNGRGLTFGVCLGWISVRVAAGQQKQVCGYFLKGACKFGHKCKCSLSGPPSEDLRLLANEGD